MILFLLAVWDVRALNATKKLASEARAPEEVLKFLQDDLKLDTNRHPEFFKIVKLVLCDENSRYPMTELLDALSNLSKKPGDDLPWIVMSG